MKSETNIALSIIIVNFNAAFFLERCLESIYQNPPQMSFEVLVIDNGSHDKSAEMVESKFPQVVLIKNPVDLHYSKATNQGIRQSNGRYLFCLNPDTIVLPNTFGSVVQLLEENPHAAAVGSRLLNPDLSDQGTSRRFPTPMSALFGRKSFLTKWFQNNRFSRRYMAAENRNSTEPYEVDWLSSAAMLVRKSLVEQVGGLDESFYYWVDADWCYRIKKAGWKIYCLPASKVIHDEGKGSGQKDKKTLNQDIIDFHRGAYRYYCRHYPLGPFHFMKLLAFMGLSLRAFILLTMNTLQR